MVIDTVIDTIGKAILLVESDEATAELERRGLSRSGLGVRRAAGVAQALELLRTERFQAVLLEYELPDGEPWTVVAAARAQHPPVPVILVTAACDERVVRQALRHGVADYIAKSGSFWEDLAPSIVRVVKAHDDAEQMRRASALFELVSGNSADMFAVLRPNMRISFASPACVNFFGCDAESLVGVSLLDLVVDEDRGAILQLSMLSVAHPQMTVQFRCRHPKAGQLWVESTFNARFEGSSTKVKEVIQVARDVTLRIRLESELRSAKELYRSLYESTPMMLHSTDPQGRIISVSDAWLSKLGYTRPQVIGQHASVFLTAESREFARDVVMPQFLRTGRYDHVRYQMVHSDGRLLDVLTSAIVERDDKGAAVRSLVVSEDVTDTLARSKELKSEHDLRVQLERRAEELDALLGERSEMLYVLAHEVRQPLNNASAVLQSAGGVLTQKGETSAADQLRHAQGLMGKILADIDNTLAVATLVSASGPAEFADTDIDTLLEIVVGDMPAADRARVRIDRRTATRTAQMDMGLMRLAIRNLLANALRYSTPTGPVSLRLADSDEPLAILFEVEDAGPGIGADRMPALFERGIRSAASHQVPGHGLGLYIARRIMEIHGGRIEVVRSDQAGTLMRLTVPQTSLD